MSIHVEDLGHRLGSLYGAARRCQALTVCDDEPPSAHRFQIQLQSGETWSEGHSPYALLRVGLATEVTPLPGFARLGKEWSTFADGNVSRLAFSQCEHWRGPSAFCGLDLVGCSASGTAFVLRRLDRTRKLPRRAECQTERALRELGAGTRAPELLANADVSEGPRSTSLHGRHASLRRTMPRSVAPH